MKSVIPWLRAGLFIFIGLCIGYWHGARWANIQSYIIGINTGYYMGVSDAETAYKTSGLEGVQKINKDGPPKTEK